MYRNFVPYARNLCIHPCPVGFGDVIFYDYLQKMCFSEKVVYKFGAKSSKKKLIQIGTQMGDLEVGSTVYIFVSWHQAVRLMLGAV